MDFHHESRLEACWRIQTCHNCLNSDHGCGWCPTSSLCIPTSGILEPVTNKNVCPLKDERFELRTKPFGCGCSTTTLLTAIVTVFATIIAFGVLSAIGVFLLKLNRDFGSGTWRGTELEIKEVSSTRIERQWKRGGWLPESIRSIFRRRDFKTQSEQDLMTERSRLLG